MAELLIKAEGPNKGDIIVVRPDGWGWGNEECVPRFLVAHIDEEYETAKVYEYPVMGMSYKALPNGKIKARNIIVHNRRYNIDLEEVDKHISKIEDPVGITPVELKAKLKDKKNGNAA